MSVWLPLWKILVKICEIKKSLRLEMTLNRSCLYWAKNKPSISQSAIVFGTFRLPEYLYAYIHRICLNNFDSCWEYWVGWVEPGQGCPSDSRHKSDFHPRPGCLTCLSCLTAKSVWICRAPAAHSSHGWKSVTMIIDDNDRNVMVYDANAAPTESRITSPGSGLTHS